MLYLMRHGRTDWNDQHRLQGRTDVELNDAGREMARAAAAEYKDVNFDICFCSPLKRAKETAQILLEGRSVPVEYDDRLMEMSFGEFEGLADSFKSADCPINMLFWKPDEYVALGGGESLEELFAREKKFLLERVDPLIGQGKDVLIFCIFWNCCIEKNIPVEHFWDAGIDNCKLMRLR